MKHIAISIATLTSPKIGIGFALNKAISTDHIGPSPEMRGVSGCHCSCCGRCDCRVCDPQRRRPQTRSEDSAGKCSVLEDTLVVKGGSEPTVIV